MQRASSVPRPRPSFRRPGYPRCLGLALVVVASTACDRTGAEPEPVLSGVSPTHFEAGPPASATAAASEQAPVLLGVAPVPFEPEAD